MLPEDKDNTKDKEDKNIDTYSEYYKIKSNIELHKQNIQKELDKLEKLARKQQEQLETPKIYQYKPRKQKIIETSIIVLIFIVVLGAIAYVSLAGLFPNLLPFGTTGYSIAAEDPKILQISEFYIDDTSVLGDKQTYQGMTIRPITSSKKFNLIFKPAKTIEPTTATLTLNLIMLNNSNIYLNDNLIFPNLDNYELIRETNDGYNIYIRKDILEHTNLDNLKDEASASHFLYENFPSSSVWSTSELEAVNPIVANYKQEWTEINTTFRGDLHLAIYAEDNLNIKMTKQDLNNNLGADEYTINITNYKGELIYTGLMGDDGVKENTGQRGEEQDFEVNKEVEEGIYYIDFIGDENNKYVDVSVRDIKINSNKIVILGKFLPIAPFKFYIKENQKQTIGFYYWHTGKDQLIIINGTENRIIDLNESWILNTYDHNLVTGEYIIELEKGDLWITTELVSPSKESWFNIPLIIKDKFSDQDFLIIDSYTYDHYNKIFLYEGELEVKGDEKFSFRALEKDAVAIESVNLELK